MMNTSPTTKTIVDVQRVMRLLDCYGADPQRWPDHERADAVALLAREAELQRYRENAALLDGYLQYPSHDPAGTDLAERILRALPAQTVPPEQPWCRFWRFPRPVLAGLIVSFGVAAGIFIYHGFYPSPPPPAMSAMLEQWLDEQLLNDTAGPEMQTLAALEPDWFEDE